MGPRPDARGAGCRAAAAGAIGRRVTDPGRLEYRPLAGLAAGQSGGAGSLRRAATAGTAPRHAGSFRGPAARARARARSLCRAAAVADRRADELGDSELGAYNDMLAELAARDASGRARWRNDDD